MRNDQMKKKMVEKEVDSRGGEKRCRRSDSPVASVHLPASEKESSGLGQQNVWTKGSADRDNIPYNNSTEEEEISKYSGSDVSQCAAECSVRSGDDTIAEIEQNTANAIASINKGKWKDGEGILKDSVTRTKSKLGGKLVSMVWKFYYMSTEKNSVTRRARVKCKFCHFELDGRLERMLSHSENYKDIIPHDRHQVYTMLALKQKFTLGEDPLSRKKNGGVQSEHLYPTSGNKVATSTTLRSHFGVLKLTAAEQEKNNELLTKSIIDGGISFSFIENIFFRRFMKSIRPAYNIISKWKMINKLLPQQAAFCSIQMLEEHEGQNDLTPSLDGWDDRKGRSIFAFIASCRDLKQPFLLDIVDLSSMRHTAENLKDQIVQVLQRLGIGMQKLRAVVTDNPAVMQKFRRLLTSDYPHMIELRCFAHAVNLLVSGYLRNGIPKNALKKSCRLISYFNESQYWSAAINSWAKSNGINHKLETFCETRWYSVVNVFRSVHEHEPAFRYCLEKNENGDCPSIPQDVKDIIIDRAHFRNNEMCLKLTRTISDTIAESEKTAFTLADCLLRFMVIYKATALLDFPLLYGELKQHFLSTVQRRFEDYFRNPVYVVALFLHPKYKSLAISSELYNTKDTYGAIIFFASVWRFTKAKVRDMREAVRDYSKGIGYFADFDGVVTYPTEWWQNFKSKQPGIEGLRKLAILVHEIVPHVADIERMFLLLGYQHTKSLNNMSTSTLKKIGQLKRYLSLEKTRQVEFEKVERRGDSHKKNSAVKGDCGATLQRDIDMAEDKNADNIEDNDGIAASEDDETFCMLAELEQGSLMEDKYQRRLCLTSSRLDATRRSDVERVAAETMLELWLSIISEEDEIESSKAVLASNGAASSSTRNHRQSGHMLFGWRLALVRTTKIGDLIDLNSTVLMALLTAKTQSTQNKNAPQKCASESRKDADDERTDWNLHEFIKLQREEDIPGNGEDLNFW